MTWPPRRTGPDRLPAERRVGDVQLAMRLFASLDAGFVKLYRKYMGLHVYQLPATVGAATPTRCLA